MNASAHPLAFVLLKTLSYVSLAAMAAAILYAVVTAVRYWPVINV